MRFTLEYPSEIPTAAPGLLAPEVLDSAERLGQAVDGLRADLAAAGRNPAAIEVQVEVTTIDFGDPAAVRRAVEQLRDLEDRGGTWAIVHVDALG